MDARLACLTGAEHGRTNGETATEDYGSNARLEEGTGHIRVGCRMESGGHCTCCSLHPGDFQKGPSSPPWLEQALVSWSLAKMGNSGVVCSSPLLGCELFQTGLSATCTLNKQLLNAGP